MCVTAVRALLTTFSDPYNAMDSRVYPDTSLMGAASIWPLAMVNSVHHHIPPYPTISHHPPPSPR